MKSPTRSPSASNDSTSRRRFSSPTQACARWAARASGASSAASLYSWLIRANRSGVIDSPSGQVAMEPDARELPVAPHCAHRDLERLRRLFLAQATEVAQLDHLRLSRVERLEPRQCLESRLNGLAPGQKQTRDLWRAGYCHLFPIRRWVSGGGHSLT